MTDRRFSYSDDGPADQHEDVFGDAFAVDEDMDMIADGFRPSLDHDREGGDLQDTPSSSTRPISRQQTPTPSRNSTRKSRPQENPFASPDDANGEHLLRRTPSGNYIPITHRSISPASSGQFARSSSQRLGGAGPSHPYAMYPQGTLARTASVATSSTARPGRSTPRPTGPQHPYSLYPQGVDGDLDDQHEDVQNSVPIGFPGLGQTFQRQRGPDGEEQDIVGYYGHTEQLPPYSRYPDEGPEKQPLLPVPAPPEASHSHAPVQGTDPSMPLMTAQIQPTQPPQQPPQSMTDESELTRQMSNASRSSENLLGGAASTRSSELSKKAWSEKSWKERRKTRVCGVPCWWYIVVVAVVLFILVVSGGAVGGFVAGQRKAEQKLSKVVTTTGYDASIISTPTSTVPLPTGTWALDLGPAQQPQSQCLTIAQQRSAWDCHLAYGNEVAIHVQTPHDGPQSGAYLSYFTNPYESGLTYGSQTSQMNTSFSPFIWVHDVDFDDTPALYFKTSYDKLVVIPEDALDISSKKIKRDGGPPHWFEGETAGPGTKPWYCFWNDTLIEGFIYPNKQIRRLPSSSVPSTSSFSTPAWASTITASPSQTITTTITMSSTTAIYTGAASKFPKWLHEKYPNFNMTTYTQPPAKLRRDDDKDKNDPDDSSDGNDSQDTPDNVYGLKVYPYQVKLEERRLPGSPLPYCIQYQVLNDGIVNWIPGPETQQIVVQLSEKNPPFRPVLYPEQPGSSRSRRRKRNESPESCHCQWMSGADN